MMERRDEKIPESATKIWRSGSADTGRHTKQLSEYARHKRRSSAVARHILKHFLEYRKQAERLRTCGMWLHYRHFFEKDRWQLCDGFTCQQHFLCGCCARRRSVRYSHAYADKVRALLMQHPELVPVFITLTVKNGPDLAERFDTLWGANKVLTSKRRQALAASTNTRGKFKNTVMRFVAGAAGTYEFKRGENSGEFHPHIHQVALLEPIFEFTPVLEPVWGKDPQTDLWVITDTKTIYKPLEFESALSREWHDATGDSYIVDVRGINVEDQEEFMGALLEVFSYTLKINDMSIEDQLHSYQVMLNGNRLRRLLFSYGNMRGVDLSILAEEPVEDELKMEKYFNVWYEYHHSSTSYRIDYIDPVPHIYQGSKPRSSVSRSNRVVPELIVIRERVKDWVAGKEEKSDLPF